MAGFPDLRLRRLREREPVRNLARETRLSSAEFIYPMFVTHGQGLRTAIEPMPGCYHFSIDQLTEEVEEVASLGIPAVLLFGLPEEKDALGTEGYDPEGIIQEAVRAIKRATPDMMVITDVCMCEYTDHGHCGVIENGRVDNDKTLELLARTAVSHAQAGADMVAPSAMMDGQVWAIRQALNAQGHTDLPIMGYAAKYASAFYGPFRVAADSTPQFGDRRSYQMDPAAAAGQALREVELDLAEGADIIMVKPALSYLDILCRLQQQFPGVPLAAYNVSGEYSMVQAAAEKGWIDGESICHESLLAIHRAGADMILTYWALDVARWYRAQQS